MTKSRLAHILRSMPRLFLAVFPPVGVVELLDGLERPEVEGLRWTMPGTVVSQPFEAEFLASELWLVSSQLHSDGSRYTRLNHWPLIGRS